MILMAVLLLQLDGGEMPNVALMRLSANLKHEGVEVHFRRAYSVASVQPQLFDPSFEQVYASTIFSRTKRIADEVREVYHGAIVSGTGTLRDKSELVEIGGAEEHITLEALGFHRKEYDYSLYPKYLHSIGFSQRGCRLRCGFCVVPRTEGAVTEEHTIVELYRGEPHARNIVLLDNDFFGQPNWTSKIREIIDGRFKVSFNQGINIRFITDEAAQAVASVPYYDNDFSRRCIYTAWDNRKDEVRLFRGLELLTKYGVKPDHIMVYMLIGYWPGETHEDREYRRAKLREFGCRPYPMPFTRTPELIGFQRWVVRRADLMCSWAQFQLHNYRPERIKADGTEVENV